ncbi:MAG: hypothetical protein WEB53_09900 [Akkermansiaceae bacterium]
MGTLPAGMLAARIPSNRALAASGNNSVGKLNKAQCVAATLESRQRGLWGQGKPFQIRKALGENPAR